jgi:hypothetical protein
MVAIYLFYLLMLYYPSKLSLLNVFYVYVFVGSIHWWLSVRIARSLHVHVAGAVCGGLSVIHMIEALHTHSACKHMCQPKNDHVGVGCGTPFVETAFPPQPPTHFVAVSGCVLFWSRSLLFL